MHIFQKRGEIDNMMALYDLPTFKGEKSVARILRDIKFKTGVEFTKEEIFSDEVENAIKIDKKIQRRLMVTGTPTIFLDGKWDRLRQEFSKYAIK